jgi:hypothetical protein
VHDTTSLRLCLYVTMLWLLGVGLTARCLGQSLMVGLIWV